MKKTAIVTGASGDIGYAICENLLNHNYIVIGTYFKNERTVSKLKKKWKDSFYYIKCDLSNINSIKAITDFITKEQFKIDVLINNAGMSIVGLVQDLSLEQWNKIWNTNVTSAVFLSKLLIPHFLHNGCGKIINISSVWGNCGASCEVAYSTTKGAINTFTKALAKELAPSNIQVNAISCGIIDTKMNGHLSKSDIDSIAEEIPCGRIGTVKDISKAVYAILTAGNYMTGQIITVDGGWTV